PARRPAPPGSRRAGHDPPGRYAAAPAPRAPPPAPPGPRPRQPARRRFPAAPPVPRTARPATGRPRSSPATTRPWPDGSAAGRSRRTPQPRQLPAQPFHGGLVAVRVGEADQLLVRPDDPARPAQPTGGVDHRGPQRDPVP